MRITLNDEESLDFLNRTNTTAETIARLEARIVELENKQVLSMSTEQHIELKTKTTLEQTTDRVTEYEKDMREAIQEAIDHGVAIPLATKKPNKVHSYPKNVTRESVLRPRWTKMEENILLYRISPVFNAVKSERTLANAMARIPERSESAIYSKILELGGHVTHGVICKK